MVFASYKPHAENQRASQSLGDPSGEHAALNVSQRESENERQESEEGSSVKARMR